jgi:hypothetical protein
MLHRVARCTFLLKAFEQAGASFSTGRSSSLNSVAEAIFSLDHGVFTWETSKSPCKFEALALLCLKSCIDRVLMCA